MQMKSNVKTIGACIAVAFGVLVALGCSFDPLSYMSRNACEFVNCDELFFIEDILPLSARPTGDAGAGGGIVADVPDDDDDGGGHAH